MEIRILQKIGNSIGVTIPALTLKKLKWKEKDVLQIRIVNDEYIVLNKIVLHDSVKKPFTEGMLDEQKN